MGKKKGRKESRDQQGGPSSSSDNKPKQLPEKERPTTSQEPGPLQGAGDGRAAPTSQQKDPTQGDWRTRGPPTSQQPRPSTAHQQGPPQGDWRTRGPPTSQQPRPSTAHQQGPPQGDWRTRGPPTSQQQGPSSTHQQRPPQGAWGTRGQPTTQQQGPSSTHQQGPPQGAWGTRGQPTTQQQGPSSTHQQGPPQGDWRTRGPPTSQQQGPSSTHQQGPPQGAWGTRGQSTTQQQGPSSTHQQGPPQGAWGTRGPPAGLRQGSAPSQQQGPPQGRDGRAPTPGQQQSIQKQDTRKKETGPDLQRSISSSSVASSGSSEGTLEFAPRITHPNKSGRKIVVRGNFFRLNIQNPKTEVYHYEVTIEPDKPQSLHRLVWNTFAAAKFPQRLAAYHKKIALSKGPLINSKSCSATVSVVNPENQREKEFNVTITEVKRTTLSCFEHFKEDLTRDKSRILMAQYEINALDLIISHHARENFIAARKHFMPLSSVNPECIELSDKLVMKSGYFQSAVLGYAFYLNFDVAYKPFYKSASLLNILDSFRNRRTNDINIDEFNRYIRTAKIEYELPQNPSSRRIFRANKLVDSAKRQKFKREDGTEMTVAQYFAEEKKCRLKYPELPLLWVGPVQKEIYVPLEFCKILPDQIYNGVCDPQETKKMVQVQAKINARERFMKVNEMLRNINLNSNPLMQEFGISVTPEMEKIPARILDPPTLLTKENISVNEGAWRIRSFLQPVGMSKWCIINTDRYVRKENLFTLQNIIKTKGTFFRMQIGDPKRDPMDVEPSFAALKKAFSQLRDMDIVFVIIADMKGIYSRVKTICETQEGVLTQCLKSKTISQDPRVLSSTMDNILLKVNPKLGGKNHCLSGNSVPQCLDPYTMIVGADVTHSSPGMKIPSVAAVAASCDPDFFQYSNTIRVQPKGEIIIDLEEIMSIHLRRFYELRKQYPKMIIFFRDGVSEGELAKILKTELAAVKRACSSVCQPKITFIVVQKRHHARFFPTRREDEGKNCNVPSGTCVDSVVVNPRDLDFYLVSHSSGLGTARPTRYRLLYDDNKLTDQDVEQLSFYFCHMVTRCNKAVSYPAPTYYAHLSAFRARAYLDGLNISPDEDIRRIQKKMEDNISRISPMFFV